MCSKYDQEKYHNFQNEGTFFCNFTKIETHGSEIFYLFLQHTVNSTLVVTETWFYLHPVICLSMDFFF